MKGNVWMKTRLKVNSKKRKWIRYSLLSLGAVLIGLSIYLYNVYSNVANAVDKMNKPIERKVSSKRDDKIQFNRKDPISILLVGVDERDGDSRSYRLDAGDDLKPKRENKQIN